VILPDADNSYREIAGTLTPTAVSQFLAANAPWVLESKVDHIKEIWTRPEGDVTPRARVLLPLATDYADYDQRFADVLRAIALVYDWDADELQRRIVSTHADMLFVRLDQVEAEDTIPLGQAEATIDALYEMVKAAAITAAAPNRSQRDGRLPAVVSTFLDEDVRLGHTKHGSFVFTVVTRLDRPVEPQAQRSIQASEPDAVPMFPRTVMETLARGLETTRDLAQGRAAVPVENAAQYGLSAGLVESLEDMAGPESLRSLDLSFEWAAAETRPTVGADPIRLEHAQVSELTRVREQLLRQEGPPHRETLIGMVKELARADEGLEFEDAGAVVISAEVTGRKRNVHMILSGEDHGRAIESYQRRLPLIVTGDLVFERRAWRLVGEIEVDSSIVERGRPVTAHNEEDRSTGA
jgi:hypothetical protein